MGRLDPPLLPDREAVLTAAELAVPPEGLGRNEVLENWQERMPAPVPRAETLELELRGWSGNLGARPWVKAFYGDTSAMVMRKPSIRITDLPVWTSVLDACTDHVDPLSRYTAGWSISLESLRPPGLRNDLLTPIREGERIAARKVRASMVNDDGVIESSDTTERFHQDPSLRHPIDEKVALRTYLAELRKILTVGTVGRSKKRPLDEDEESLVADLFGGVADDSGVVLDDGPDEETVESYRRRATEFLNRVVRERFRLEKANRELISEAYARLHTSYVNRQRFGKPLEGTEHWLHLRLDAVRADQARRLSDRSGTELPLQLNDDPDSHRSDDRTDDPATAAAISDHDAVMRTAVEHLRDNPDLWVGSDLIWEAATATRLLAGDDEVVRPSPMKLRAYLVGKWDEEKPGNSRSPSAAAAATYTVLLMRTALTAVSRPGFGAVSTAGSETR